jgi:hypothetical protein
MESSPSLGTKMADLPYRRQDVRVSVRRLRYRAAGETFADHLRVLVGQQQERCAGVAKIVGVEVWQAGPLQDRLERAT